MKIFEVTDYLEHIAPLQLQEDYDNAGLITGNKSDDVMGILLCLDSIEAVVDEAIALGCNLIIAHHPIVFSGLKKITGSTYVERVIIKAIRHNIAIYAIHTNLDNVLAGVNQAIADRLGLTDCKPLLPKKYFLKKLVTFVPENAAEKLRLALFDNGGGGIGHYDHCSFTISGTGTFRGDEQSNPFVGEKGTDHSEPEARIEMIFPASAEKQLITALLKNHPYEEVAYDIYTLDNAHQGLGAGLVGNLPEPQEPRRFLNFLKEAMETECIRHSVLLSQPIHRVALCGGSGSFLTGDAIRSGAQIFISADFKYHQFFDAGNQIVLADIGHYESEQFTIMQLGGFLQKKFPNFALHFTKTNTNPVKYF